MAGIASSSKAVFGNLDWQKRAGSERSKDANPKEFGQCVLKGPSKVRGRT